MAKGDIKESSRFNTEFDSDHGQERVKHFSRKGLNLPWSGPVPLAACRQLLLVHQALGCLAASVTL